MFQMNEKFFAEIQKNRCWFTTPIHKNLPDIDSGINVMDESIWDDNICVQRHIFAMIFGSFGYSVDLLEAKRIATIKLKQIEKQEPKDNSQDNSEFIKWLELLAHYNILLGTVFAYLHNYPSAVSLLIKGLKIQAVNLFMPYYHFIEYVFSKVAEMPAEVAEYNGCGFSVDEPMGSIELNNGILIAGAAEVLIPALEGNNGEIILVYQGGQRYGNLERLGSTNSENFRNCIDVYDVLMMDQHFNIKKLRLFFNGYFTLQKGYNVRLPKGFHLDPLSKAGQLFKIVA